MLWLLIIISYVVMYVGIWREVFRSEVHTSYRYQKGKKLKWDDFFNAFTLASVVALVAPAVIVGILIHKAIDPDRLAKRIAGDPKETKEEKIKRLEKSNKQMAKELGLDE